MSSKDKRFPFTLYRSSAESIVAVACGDWTEKLCQLWGAELLKNACVEISEDFYKEMRSACTEPQNKLFDEIFGEDKKREFYVKGDDGVDIYEGDSYSFFWVKRPAKGQNALTVYDVKVATIETDSQPSSDARFFATRAAAEEYLDTHHSKRYTAEDLRDATEMDRTAGSMGNIRKGSKVKIVDGSYMIFDGNGTHTSPKNAVIGWSNEVWKVIEVNVALPTDKRHMPEVLGYQNNCKIKSTVSGEVWYCSKINIKLA